MSNNDLNANLCRLEVIEAFKHLNNAICNAMPFILENDQNYPLWLQENNSRKHLYNFISTLEYSQTQKPREILLLPGIVSASEETINKILEINQAKILFKQKVLQLRKAKISHLNDPELNNKFEQIILQSNKSKNQNFRNDKLNQELSKIGLARLHLKQCYRILPILPAIPVKVSYTWAHTRAITKITAQHALELLGKYKPSQKINLQIDKLSKLNKKTPLAIIQELAPHIRCNILFAENINPKRIMLKGSVPIFYQSPCSIMPLPTIKPPCIDKKAPNPTRSKRNDTKICPEVFLPTLRAHLYNY